MAVQSMTGFGRAQGTSKRVRLVVEVRSVNHRHLDLSVKLPPAYQAFESQIAAIVRDKFRRGRIELFVTRQIEKSSQRELMFDRELFNKYLNIFKLALREQKLEAKASLPAIVLDVLRRREVLDLVETEAEPEDEWSLLERITKAAVKDLHQMRNREGTNLQHTILGHLAEFDSVVVRIAKSAKSVPERFRERLTARIEKVLNDVGVDPQRIAQEVALFADRTDVTEEIARLASHQKQFRALIKNPECGRKLDFLIQEMGRETNTIGSKAQDGNISAAIVEAKAVLERIREQVQNVE